MSEENMSVEKNFDSRQDISMPKPLSKGRTSEFVPQESKIHAYERGGGVPRVEGENGEQWASWLVPNGKDDDDYKTAPNAIQRLVQRIARRPDEMITPDVLIRAYDDLEKLTDSREATDADIALWQSRLTVRQREIVTSEKGSKNREEHAGAEYEEFLKNERWGGIAMPIDEKSQNQPFYYQEFSDREKVIHKIRREIVNAMNYKRGEGGESLEALGKNRDLAGISKTEMKLLYQEMPGIRHGMKYYATLIDDPNNIRFNINGRDINIFESKDREDVEAFRDYIAHEIASHLTGPNADSQAKEAEQVVFNLLYLGNTFESFDSRWEMHGRTMIRTRGPKLVAEEIGQAGIRTAIKPMDALIETTYRPEAKLREAGNLGLWAYTQTQDSIRRQKLLDTVKRRADTGQAVYDFVQILEETDRNKDAFWTVQRDKRGALTLKAPECYPIRILGSVWEETRIKDPRTGVSKTLWEYMKDVGTEIPWDAPEAQSFWKDYLGSVQKGSVFNEFVTGKKPINMAQFGGAGIWLSELNNVLGKFGQRTSSSLRRWILYASHGVLIDKREPRIRLDKPGKRILKGTFGDIGMHYLSNDGFYFPWDEIGFNIF